MIDMFDVNRFKRNRRAYWSLIIFAVVFCLSVFSELIANDNPLIVKYKNDFYFPVFKEYLERDFGGDFPTVADYRDELISNNIRNNGWAINTIIPFSFNRLTVSVYI